MAGLLLAGLVWGADAPKPAPPAIPEDLSTSYWAAQAKLADAKAQFAASLTAAQKTLQEQIDQASQAATAATGEALKVCGKDWQLQLGQVGADGKITQATKLFCAAKPKVEPAK